MQAAESATVQPEADVGLAERVAETSIRPGIPDGGSEMRDLVRGLIRVTAVVSS